MKPRIHLYIILTLLLSACGRPYEETVVQSKDISELIFASGILEPDNRYNLTAQTDGILIELKIEEGTQVSKGQLLGKIDNNQNIINAASASDLYQVIRQNALPESASLKQIESNILAARKKLEHDLLQAERYQRLIKNNSVSQLEYDSKKLSVDSSEASLQALLEQYDNQKQLNLQQEILQRSSRDVSKVIQDRNHLKAVHSGKVYQLKKQLGDYVRKGEIIATIGNPNVIYARLNIDESNIAKIQNGQVAIVRLNVDKDRTYESEIREILPAFDDSSQSFIVKAFFTEKLDFKISGTQLEANIIIGEKLNATVIPRSYFGYGNKVLLKNGEHVFVKTGIISNEWVEILQGLEQGETIARQKL